MKGIAKGEVACWLCLRTLGQQLIPSNLHTFDQTPSLHPRVEIPDWRRPVQEVCHHTSAVQIGLSPSTLFTPPATAPTPHLLVESPQR